MANDFDNINEDTHPSDLRLAYLKAHDVHSKLAKKLTRAINRVDRLGFKGKGIDKLRDKVSMAHAAKQECLDELRSL